MTLRRLLGWLLVAAAVALGAATAQAHPHVWITAKSELIYAPDGIDHRRAPRLDL